MVPPPADAMCRHLVDDPAQEWAEAVSFDDEHLAWLCTECIGRDLLDLAVEGTVLMVCGHCARKLRESA